MNTKSSEAVDGQSAGEYNERKNGLHGTGPLKLHSSATLLSTELICKFARIETDVELFTTLARLLGHL